MTRRFFGILGSILGLWFPSLALLAATPPLGWGAMGGREPLSLFSLDPFRPYESRPNEALSVADYPCPGRASYVALLNAPLPDDAWALPNGIIACILPAADGRAARVRMMDGQGRVLSQPGLAAAIKAGWRFEARPGVRPSWQSVRIDAWRAPPQPLRV